MGFIVQGQRGSTHRDVEGLGVVDRETLQVGGSCYGREYRKKTEYPLDDQSFWMSEVPLVWSLPGCGRARGRTIARTATTVLPYATLVSASILPIMGARVNSL